MAWGKFEKLSQYLRNRKFPLASKKKILYALERWMLTKTLGCKIRSTQIKMERKILGVAWREK